MPITRQKRPPILKWAIIIILVLILGGIGLRGPDILAYLRAAAALKSSPVLDALIANGGEIKVADE